MDKRTLPGKSRDKLTERQILYAEWLAKAPWERSPKTQKQIAHELGVISRTVQLWERIPELSHLVIEINIDRLASLVAPATALMERAIKEPGSVSRVSFDAAKYIVQDWAKRNQAQGDIVQTIADIYKKYHHEGE